MKHLLTKSFATALPVVSLSLFAACVSPRQYDESVAGLKMNQKTLHEKEQYITTLEAENERLKRALAQNDVSALSEAGYGEDLESRLSELQSKIDNLGRPLKDIERFDVEGGYVLMVQDKILFASGSADLSAEGKKAVAELAGDINAKPHRQRPGLEAVDEGALPARQPAALRRARDRGRGPARVDRQGARARHRGRGLRPARPDSSEQERR
jgi:hypothetical protein